MTVSAAQSVWIVDDDDSVRWVLEKAMERDGMDVRGYADPLTALDNLAAERPDVLITDIRMPGMDGLGIFAANRRNEHRFTHHCYHGAH